MYVLWELDLEDKLFAQKPKAKTLLNGASAAIWDLFSSRKKKKITPYSHRCIFLSCTSRTNISVYEDRSPKKTSKEEGGLEISPSATFLPLEMKRFAQSTPLPRHAWQSPGNNSPAGICGGPHNAFTYFHPGNSNQFAFTKLEYRWSREIPSKGPGISLLLTPAWQVGSFMGLGCVNKRGEILRIQTQRHIVGRTGRKGSRKS